MTMPPDDGTLTLVGLVGANGPWLAARLFRLGELSGLRLDQDVVEHAVAGASKTLAEVLSVEGHPSLAAGEEMDPVVLLGREQAQSHQQAGLPMPASLKVQRLLRRAYDDLVRESWVERDSRARAHEDVERFFERALVGLVAAWSGQPAFAPPPVDPALAELAARREDELRRTLDTAKKLTQMLRETKARADALEAQLAQREEQTARSMAKLKAEFTEMHARALAQAEARLQAEKQTVQARLREVEDERAALGARLADLEMVLAAHGDAESARLAAEKELERARTEADRERARAEGVRVEVQTLEEAAQDLRRQAGQRAQGDQAEAETLRAELRALREAHANLASEAEAMRLRLSEAGSRVSELRRAEEGELQTRLAQAQACIAALEEELRRAGRGEPPVPSG